MECIYSSVREISVRKMTVDEGSASRGMIVMCGEKRIAAEAEIFHHSGVKTNTEVLKVDRAALHSALTCV